jgi:hypothetical protein
LVVFGDVVSSVLEQSLAVEGLPLPVSNGFVLVRRTTRGGSFDGCDLMVNREGRPASSIVMMSRPIVRSL